MEKQNVVIASVVKKMNTAEGFKTSADLLEELADVVIFAVAKAQNRAKANGRKTVTAKDV